MFTQLSELNFLFADCVNASETKIYCFIPWNAKFYQISSRASLD